MARRNEGRCWSCGSLHHFEDNWPLSELCPKCPVGYLAKRHVKKEGLNKDQPFVTCSSGKVCGFFNWDDYARHRPTMLTRPNTWESNCQWEQGSNSIGESRCLTGKKLCDVMMEFSTLFMERLIRNRRALDEALRWMDLPPELCTLESVRKMASDIVNFLSGRSHGPATTTTTTPATATGTTATSAPTEAGPKQSQHGSTSTHSTPANAPPATVDASPPKRMLDKEYQRKNLKKPKQ
ncbi:hypothetical protein Syun_014845 [Stephania yunnanensis]|uniref:GRF-type domain-containing protein n=1 Tax=Stephania yunnanensis TaxID=152371 RepID=A0AAP0JKY9_9MAGN